MNIKEAIKTLEVTYEAEPSLHTLHWYKALKLGIEALKRIEEHRNKGYLRAHELLLGETEE